jgi:hypothetical protein
MVKLFGLLVLFGAAPALAQSSTYVKGYFRSDGSYVAPHYRTNPDSSRMNNWSSETNINPYTGKQGTVDPFAPKVPSSSGFRSYRPKGY